jgi:hypothetical protein
MRCNFRSGGSLGLDIYLHCPTNSLLSTRKRYTTYPNSQGTLPARGNKKHTMTNLTKHKSRISSDTEEGLLDLSAVTEGLITIERDGSFKDTEKLTALLTALDAKAAARRAELRAEGLDIQLDPALASYRAATTDYHAASLALEACAKMLPLASDAQLSILVDQIATEMESGADALVDAAKSITYLLA